LPRLRLALNRLDFIRPKFCESPPGFSSRKASEPALQAGQGFLDREVMDFHRSLEAVFDCALSPAANFSICAATTLYSGVCTTLSRSGPVRRFRNTGVVWNVTKSSPGFTAALIRIGKSTLPLWLRK